MTIFLSKKCASFYFIQHNLDSNMTNGFNLKAISYSFLMIIFFTLVFNYVHASSNLRSEITQLVRICAPGNNLWVEVEGKVGSLIDDQLKEVMGKAEKFEDAKILETMISASPKDAAEIYKIYANCVKPSIQKIFDRSRELDQLKSQADQLYRVMKGSQKAYYSCSLYVSSKSGEYAAMGGDVSNLNCNNQSQQMINSEIQYQNMLAKLCSFENHGYKPCRHLGHLGGNY